MPFTVSVKSGGQATRKVYSTSQKASGYHLGKAGDVLPSNAKPCDAVGYKGQCYNDLKRHCQKNGCLFEDPEFPAIEASLFYSGKKPPRQFIWKRPSVSLHLDHIFCFSSSSEYK